MPDRTGTAKLLLAGSTISKVRDKVLTSNDMRLVVTIHPSYLLRIEDADRGALIASRIILACSSDTRTFSAQDSEAWVRPASLACLCSLLKPDRNCRHG